MRTSPTHPTLALALTLAGALALAGCGADDVASGGGTTTKKTTSTATTTTTTTTGGAGGGAQAALTVTSAAFTDGAALPAAYSCDGAGTSPPLAWAGAPAGTKTFALLVTDPDAPTGPDFTPTSPRTTFVHWTVYDLPAGTTSLAEGATLPAGAQAAEGWFAACPPAGDIVHHYHFDVLALDLELAQPPSAFGSDATPSSDKIRAAVAGHVLAEGRLSATYQK